MLGASLFMLALRFLSFVLARGGGGGGGGSGALG